MTAISSGPKLLSDSPLGLRVDSPLVVSGGKEETLVFWKNELSRRDFCPRLLSEVHSICVASGAGLVSVALASGARFVLRVDSFQIEFEENGLRLPDSFGERSQGPQADSGETLIASDQNLFSRNGLARLIRVSKSDIQNDLFMLTQRNQLFNPERNKNFDYRETTHKSKNFIFLFENLRLRRTGQNIFQRIKFFSFDFQTGQPVLMQTFQENTFDPDLRFVHSLFPLDDWVQPGDQPTEPIFVSVHSRYSKVWECVEDKKKKARKWQNVLTHWEEDVVAQSVEQVGEGFLFYSVRESQGGQSKFSVSKWAQSTGSKLCRDLTKEEGRVSRVILSESKVVLVSAKSISIRERDTLRLVGTQTFERVLFAKKLGPKRIPSLVLLEGRIRVFFFDAEKNKFEEDPKTRASLPSTPFSASCPIKVLFDDISRYPTGRFPSFSLFSNPRNALILASTCAGVQSTIVSFSTEASTEIPLRVEQKKEEKEGDSELMRVVRRKRARGLGREENVREFFEASSLGLASQLKKK